MTSPKPETVDEMSEVVELHGCGSLICCDPRRAPHRFMVLIFICFLSFGKLFFNKIYSNFNCIGYIWSKQMNIYTKHVGEIGNIQISTLLTLCSFDANKLVNF